MTRQEKIAAINARTAAIKAAQANRGWQPLFDHCAVDIDHEDADERLLETSDC